MNSIYIAKLGVTNTSVSCHIISSSNPTSRNYVRWYLKKVNQKHLANVGQLGELGRMQIWILWIYKNPWENNEVTTSQQKRTLNGTIILVHPWRFIKIYYTKAFKKIFERMYFFSTSIFTIRSSILQSVNTYHFMSVLKSRKKSGPKAKYITLKMGPNQVINGIVTP